MLEYWFDEEDETGIEELSNMDLIDYVNFSINVTMANAAYSSNDLRRLEELLVAAERRGLIIREPED